MRIKIGGLDCGGVGEGVWCDKRDVGAEACFGHVV